MKRLLSLLFVLCSISAFAQPQIPQFPTYNGTLTNTFIKAFKVENGRLSDINIPSSNVGVDTIYISNDSVYYKKNRATYFAGYIAGGGGGGSGTVTSIAGGYGMTGGTITTTGTLKVDTTLIQKKLSAGTGIAISGNTIYATGGGSYTFENGLTNTSGTVKLGGELNAITIIGAGAYSNYIKIIPGTQLKFAHDDNNYLQIYNNYLTYRGGGTDRLIIDNATGIANFTTSITTPLITITTTPSVSDSSTNAANTKFVKQAIEANNVLYTYTFSIKETPSGTVNGSNAAFTLAYTPIAGSEMVFLNGLLQDVGGGNDYTISSGTITFNTAPLTGSKIRVSYIKQ